MANLNTGSKLPFFSSLPQNQKVVSKDVIKDQLNQKNLTGAYSTNRNTPSPVPTTKVEPIDGGAQSSGKEKTGEVLSESIGADGVPDGFRGTGLKFGENGNGGRPATLSVSYKKIKNGAVGELISNYGRFILQSVSEATQEKYQIVETFTNYYVYFFGKRPMVYNFSGTLINSEYFKWANDMEYIYDKMLRGTKLAEINGTAILEYDGKMVKGYPVQLSMNKDAMNDQGVPFSFSMIITEVAQLPKSMEIEGMIEEAQKVYAAIEDEKRKYMSRLSQNIPPKAAAAVTQVTNGQVAAFTGNIPDYLNPVSQAYTPPKPDYANIGNEVAQGILSPVVFGSSNSPLIAKK